MGSLRVVPLVVLAACADISGLSSLEIGDASTEAMPDATADVTLDVVPFDVIVQPDSVTPSDAGVFCSSWTLYRWCADFDELDADVTWGFALGQPAQWTSVSPSTPTFSTHYTSPPRAAGFLGTDLQSLTFTGAPSGNQEYDLYGQLRVETVGDMPNTVAGVKVSSTYGVAVQTARSGQSYTFVVNEVIVAADGGVQVKINPLANTFVTGSWVSITLAITSQSVSLTADTANVSFNRSVGGSSNSVATTIGFDSTSWTGAWDSVRIQL